jgi:hypothetical protein
MTMTMTGGRGVPPTTMTARARGETTTEGVLDTTTTDGAEAAGGKVIAIEGIEMSEMVLVAIEEGIDDANEESTSIVPFFFARPSTEVQRRFSTDVSRDVFTSTLSF